MVYGDLQFIDIIIFAGVAGFLIYRLRNVLGKRGGLQKTTNSSKSKKENSSNNIIKTQQLKDNEKKLSIAYDVMPAFDHKNFLEGAKFAFETIINAFNTSDTKTLKKLLTKNVFDSFNQAISENANNPGFQFYSLLIDGVEDVYIEENLINIKLKITSEQFKDNDEATITKKQDLWTFQKKLNDNSPIWLLCAT